MVAFSDILNSKSKENTLYPNECTTNAYKSEYPNRINSDTFMNMKKSCYSVNRAKISLIFLFALAN